VKTGGIGQITRVVAIWMFRGCSCDFGVLLPALPCNCADALQVACSSQRTHSDEMSRVLCRPGRQHAEAEAASKGQAALAAFSARGVHSGP
jgi:hypothetical protein